MWLDFFTRFQVISSIFISKANEIEFLLENSSTRHLILFLWNYHLKDIDWNNWKLKICQEKMLQAIWPHPSVSYGFFAYTLKGKKWKQWQILFSWAPKSLPTVPAAMKLEDSCSVEGKLWQA